MKAVDRIGSAFLRAIIMRMKALGLSQSDLAQRLKCSRAYISKVLRGDVNFTFTTAAHFARALGMDFFPTLTPQEKYRKITDWLQFEICSMGLVPM